MNNQHILADLEPLLQEAAALCILLADYAWSCQAQRTAETETQRLEISQTCDSLKRELNESRQNPKLSALADLVLHWAVHNTL